MIGLKSILDDFRLYEADDDKYVSIGFGRFKLKGKEDDDDADVYVKTDSGKYEKSADQSSDDKDAKDDKPNPKKAMGIDKSGGFGDDNEESDSDAEYTFEVRWNDGNYYPCRILNENTNFAAGTYYNVDGYEDDGTPWEAHVPVSHLRLIGSEPSTNIIKDGINQAINERKRKIMDREEEKRKRTKEALELEKRRRIEEERMRRAKEEAIARQLKQAREEKARKDKIEREEKVDAV